MPGRARGFEGKVRFASTMAKPLKVFPAHEKKYANEVASRAKSCVPVLPILFTNATMLEYMLVRTEDAPILQKSQGALEWIVLDEAHCYMGSQAAELSLLLRRVQMAFGVKLPDTVRFVATSATIGDPDGPAGLELRSFLADVAGVPSLRFRSLLARVIPVLPSMKKKARHAATIWKP